MRISSVRTLRMICAAVVLLLALAIASPAQTLTTLYNFAGPDGASPDAVLVQGSDGNFYGTTPNGGTIGFGTVFQITPFGTLTTLYSFTDGTDGANPEAGLVQGSDGNFYGTSSAGGISFGSVFRITPSGTLTTLYRFPGGSDGENPYAGLLQGSDGNFYGTTRSGGTGSYGTVFKITRSGTLTTLYSFTGGTGGYYTVAGLVQGSDGNFYGTTLYGGTGGGGTVFQITPSGTLTTLYSFTGGTGGYYPSAGLVQGSDGNFYGTTLRGGTGNSGTVFQITPSGVLTTLYSFAGGTDGAHPNAGLVHGTDDNFYGTTSEGGTTGYGTVFQITPSGSLTTLYTFSGTDGANPYAGLVQGSDGNFYGTTTNRGTGSFGTVFKLQLRGVATTTAALSLNPYIGYGQAEKLSATVLARTGSPRGIVDFYDGSALLGSANLDRLGVAHLTVSSLSVGTHSITATYRGQNNFRGSTSPAITVRVH